MARPRKNKRWCIMKKKYTLKVFPAGNGREVYRVIEISGEHSLDDWMFVITVQKIEEAPEKVAPKVIKEKGAIEQYPDWDDEDDYE